MVIRRPAQNTSGRIIHKFKVNSQGLRMFNYLIRKDSDKL
jgi:hypothetical protein